MALVFAVFLLTLLVVFLRPEGRAHRVAQLKAVVARAVGTTRTVLHRGTETVDRISAGLAEDRRGTGDVNPLLNPADAVSADQRAEPSASS